MLIRYKDGDVLKLIPLCHNDGNTSFMVRATFFYNQKRVVWDTNDILHRAYMIDRKNSRANGKFGKAFLCGVKNIHSGEIGIAKFGRTIALKIRKYYEESGFDLKTCQKDTHLCVKSDIIGNLGLPSYDESYITIFESEHIDPTKWKSLNIDDFISNYGIKTHWNIVDEETGGLLSEIKSADRNKKLKELGI